MIATSQKIDLSGVDKAKVAEISGEKYFAQDKADKKKGEDEFFKQGEKPEVRLFDEGYMRQSTTDNAAEEEAIKQPRCGPEGH